MYIFTGIYNSTLSRTYLIIIANYLCFFTSISFFFKNILFSAKFHIIASITRRIRNIYLNYKVQLFVFLYLYGYTVAPENIDDRSSVNSYSLE